MQPNEQGSFNSTIAAFEHVESVSVICITNLKKGKY